LTVNRSISTPFAVSLAGDYNDNGQVEADDLNLVLFNWAVDETNLTLAWISQRPEPGTAVGVSQLNGVLFNWGNTVSAAAVPEPAALIIGLGMVLFSMVTHRCLGN